MAKDPAVLWYTSDFLTGTLTMSDEQVGKYSRLLCLQHQQGHLSEEDMLNICKSYDDRIFKKFIKDDAGCYYNERMEIEINKRKLYCESRSNNRTSKEKKSKKTSKTYVKHMEDVNEDVNEDKSKSKKFIEPTFEEFKKYAIENEPCINLKNLELKYKSWAEAGWINGKGKKIINWKSTLLNTIQYIGTVKPSNFGTDHTKTDYTNVGFSERK
jgi:hypothetical protein